LNQKYLKQHFDLILPRYLKYLKNHLFLKNLKFLMSLRYH
jgi:hypothetical protein